MSKIYTSFKTSKPLKEETISTLPLTFKKTMLDFFKAIERSLLSDIIERIVV